MSMNILITGARGFVGRNLCENLKNIKDGKNRTRPGISIGNIYEFDKENTADELDRFCAGADFIFHLAGVNRPVDKAEFISGNTELTQRITGFLQKHGNSCPVMMSSSVQATLTGRYAGSEYGKSKLEAEKVLIEHAKKTGAGIMIYRLPNLFGKWCRPNYNSVVATFCHNTANGLPNQVNDPDAGIELLYIDDLINALFDALEGHPGSSGEEYYFSASPTHKTTVGELDGIISSFASVKSTLMIPELKPGSLEKKLFSTYLSYIGASDAAFFPVVKADERGSFTELLKSADSGQISVNVSLPGVTKGMHWHNSKCEIFTVVYGKALIKMRRIGDNNVTELTVTSDRPQSVFMLPGYTHSITNLSDTEPLVTLMWANEIFDPEHPDTFFEPV